MREKMVKCASKALRKLKRSSPTIFSIAASLGVVGTVAVTSRAAPKALLLIHDDSRERHDGDPYAYTKREAFLSAWKCYIPVAIVSGATIGCIITANALNRKQQAALSAAYVFLGKSYKEYKEKVAELYGPDGELLVRTEIAKDHLHFDSDSLDDGKELFYFEYGGGDGYFQSTVADVQNAFYHFNRNFALRGYGELDEVLQFLCAQNTDFKTIKYGDCIGWSLDLGIDDGYVWIDYIIDEVIMDDGLQCKIISVPFCPKELYADD